MAKSKIPDALERRHLIEKGLTEAQALRIAEAYLAEGRLVDAIDFLAKAGDRDRLGELRAEAVTSGDAFLLRAAARALDESPTEEGPADAGAGDSPLETMPRAVPALVPAATGRSGRVVALSRYLDQVRRLRHRDAG